METEYVDQYPGYRYVKPQRQCPACYAWMAGEVAPDCKGNGYQDQRHDHSGKDNVRSEQGKIKWPDYALSIKWHVSNPGMVGQIGNHEHRGNPQRNDHAIAMQAAILITNKIISGCQQ